MELILADYIEIIQGLPPEALEELLNRYDDGKIVNEKTIVALSTLGLA